MNYVKNFAIAINKFLLFELYLQNFLKINDKTTNMVKKVCSFVGTIKDLKQNIKARSH